MAVSKDKISVLINMDKEVKATLEKLAKEDEDPNIIEEPRLGLSALSIKEMKRSNHPTKSQYQQSLNRIEWKLIIQ